VTDRHSTSEAMPAWVHGPTEQRNPRTTDLDLLPTLELLRVINAEDQLVAPAVQRALPELARAVDLVVVTMRHGGAVHYFGAGTSGRIATMDAAELGPTFGLETGRVVAHQAGGPGALGTALEDVEDDTGKGADEARVLRRGDCAIGLTASGRTPYVAGALSQARELGAATILVSSNPEAEIAAHADVHVCVETGPEALAGSTRMKAGTAQKLVLNSLSTAAMVQLGRTYSNLMTNVVAKNSKLLGRMVTVLTEVSGQDRATCAAALDDADGDLRVALVRLLSNADTDDARAALTQTGGVVRHALRLLDGTSPPTLGKDP
jgi:N-acetylmuramic acid 6-phosphate etherase